MKNILDRCFGKESFQVHQEMDMETIFIAAEWAGTEMLPVIPVFRMTKRRAELRNWTETSYENSN